MKLFLIFLLCLFSFSITVPSFAQDEYRGTQKFLNGVGAEYDKEGRGFDIDYVLEGQLHDFVLVDTELNTITFEYDSKGIEEDVLIIYLPIELIVDPLAVYINGDQEPNAIRSQVEDITRMIIPLYEDSRVITIKGEQVVPEDLPPLGNNIEKENENNNEDSKGGGCLIATASYGSELSPQIQKLREIRDNKLLQTDLGSSFIQSFNDFYYSFSPQIADLQRENPIFNETVKVLITPMITSLSILNYLDINSDAEVFIYGFSLILLNFGMYFTAPVIVIWKTKKRSSLFKKIWNFDKQFNTE